MPRPVAYIAELLPPSAELIDKIHRKHDVTLDEIREAVILTDVESSVWDWHSDPARGWRLLVTAKTYVGRRLLVVLYPVDEAEGMWRLGTAMDDDG
ncbi:MAG TPA: hypothetical protein VGP04_04770 [Pseudonocardiaceae bacterium]|nr:hypothetical protein [Pseudonocardiaceae bacterium]